MISAPLSLRSTTCEAFLSTRSRSIRSLFATCQFEAIVFPSFGPWQRSPEFLDSRRSLREWRRKDISTKSWPPTAMRLKVSISVVLFQRAKLTRCYRCVGLSLVLPPDGDDGSLARLENSTWLTRLRLPVNRRPTYVRYGSNADTVHMLFANRSWPRRRCRMILIVLRGDRLESFFRPKFRRADFAQAGGVPI